MSQSPIKVTYSLEEVLARIEGKIDDLKADGAKLFEQIKNVEIGLSEQIKNVEIGQARLEEKVTALEKDVTEIKGSQKAQIWTLIGVLGTAVVGTVIRFVITALPGNP
ncbi:MAG: hemolysin XhlA family protein [Microcystaceae cyanobacterium]